MPLFGKFSDLPKLLNEHGVRENSLDGLLIDTGCSSMQFDSAQRGFSISGDGLLDMRMSQSPEDISAFDVVNFFDETELAEIFDKYGEERKAKRIAKSIVEAR